MTRYETLRFEMDTLRIQNEQLVEEMARKDQEMALKDQQLARQQSKIRALKRQVKELKRLKSKKAFYEPTRVFAEVGDRFEDEHVGFAGEETREAELVAQLPAFATLFKHDNANKPMHLQTAQKNRYDQFSSYKKRLFWYFWRQYKIMLRSDQEARDMFGKVKRGVELRVICDLADLGNVPTQANDCWLPMEELPKLEGRARIQLGGGNSGFHEIWFAHRLTTRLKFGYDALKKRNGRETSHLCNWADCLRHTYPETHKINMNRIKCHKYGCAKSCRHQPKCQYQRDGSYLPCRSNPRLDTCECGQDCFEGVILLDDDDLDLELELELNDEFGNANPPANDVELAEANEEEVSSNGESSNGESDNESIEEEESSNDESSTGSSDDESSSDESNDEPNEDDEPMHEDNLPANDANMEVDSEKEEEVWEPRGPEQLVEGMLDPDVDFKPKLYFNQRYYRVNRIGQAGTSYICSRQGKNYKCCGSAKIENNQVRELAPHKDFCMPITINPH